MANIVIGLRNLFYWLPVIWRDRNWDYAFLLRIMVHKLDAMSLAFASDDAVTESATIKAAHMYNVARELERLERGGWLSSLHEVHAERWGEPSFITRDTEDPEFCELVSLRWPKVTNWREQAQAQKEFRLFGEKADELDAEAWAYAMNTLRDRAQSWWD